MLLRIATQAIVYFICLSHETWQRNNLGFFFKFNFWQHFFGQFPALQKTKFLLMTRTNTMWLWKLNHQATAFSFHRYIKGIQTWKIIAFNYTMQCIFNRWRSFILKHNKQVPLVRNPIWKEAKIHVDWYRINSSLNSRSYQIIHNQYFRNKFQLCYYKKTRAPKKIWYSHQV